MLNAKKMHGDESLVDRDATLAKPCKSFSLMVDWECFTLELGVTRRLIITSEVLKLNVKTIQNDLQYSRSDGQYCNSYLQGCTKKEGDATLLYIN